MMMLHTLLLSSVNAEELVYIRAFADDDYGNYHVAVLNAVFKATKEYGDITLVPHPQPMTQSRQMLSIKGRSRRNVERNEPDSRTKAHSY